MALAFLSWDKRWTRKLERLAHQYPWLGQFGLIGAVWILPLLIIVGALFQGMIWRAWIAYVFSLVLVWLVTVVLEFVFARPRPFDAGYTSALMRPMWDTPSFPSGHAALAFAVIAHLFFITPLIGWICLPVALWICFSRVLVGVHYVGDVIVGAIVGLGGGFLLIWTFL